MINMGTNDKLFVHLGDIWIKEKNTITIKMVKQDCGLISLKLHVCWRSGT